MAANGRAHAEAIRAARARLVVFPELSLTGYELDAEPVSGGDQALAPIRDACAETGSLALVGAPVADGDGGRRIATVRVGPAGADVVYRKRWLGGDEPARFSPGDAPVALDVDGWRVGLGICKDTGVAEHVRGVAALGVDLYVAGLVHRPEELEAQDARGVEIARACAAWVAFASSAGPSGGGYDATAGRSTIWSPEGTVVARAGAAPGEVASAAAG